MSTRLDPDCTLDTFDVEPGGDVFLSLGDSEGFWHGVVLSAAAVAGIAEASAARRPARTAEENAMTELGSPATATLKVDWDAGTINAVRVACLAVAEVYESYGDVLPGLWNLNDAVRLRTAAEDIRSYVDARERAKEQLRGGRLIIMTSADTPWLARGSHLAPEDCADTERCLFEWYNWLTRHQHTYRRPPGVSAVLWRFGMSLNDVLPDGRRQELARFLPDGQDRLAGTERDGRDETRGHLALDWLARAGLPAWLALAGLDEEAAALRDLPRVADSRAVLVAGITVRMAGSRAADTAAARFSRGSTWDGVRDMVRRSALDIAGFASGAAGPYGATTAYDTAHAAVESARAACLAASRAGDGETWGKRKDVIAGLQSSAIALYDVLIAGEWPPPS